MLHLGEPGGRSAQGTEPQLRRCHPASPGGPVRQLPAVAEIGGRSPPPGIRGRVFAGMGKHIPHATAITPKVCVYDQNRQQPPYLPLPPRRRADRRTGTRPADRPTRADLGRGAWGPPAFLQDLAQRPTPETAGGTTLTSFFT